MESATARLSCYVDEIHGVESHDVEKLFRTSRVSVPDQYPLREHSRSLLPKGKKNRLGQPPRALGW